MRAYRTFLVPFDFSEQAWLALETAADLARHFEGDLHLLYVIQPILYVNPGPGQYPTVSLGDLRDNLLGSLCGVASGLVDPPGDVHSHVLEGSSVASAIGQCAEELGADLVVMGTRARSGLRHAFIGSVAEKTLRSAPCPVLTVRTTAGS